MGMGWVVLVRLRVSGMGGGMVVVEAGEVRIRRGGMMDGGGRDGVCMWDGDLSGRLKCL